MVQQPSAGTVLPLPSDDKQLILAVYPIRYSRVGELREDTFILPGKVSLHVPRGAEQAYPTAWRLMRINALFHRGFWAPLFRAVVR